MRLSQCLDEAILDGFNYCYIPIEDMYTACIHTVRRKVRGHAHFIIEENVNWIYEPDQNIIRSQRNRARIVLFKDSDTINNIREKKYGNAAYRSH